MKHRKHVKIIVTPISLVIQNNESLASFKQQVETSVYIPSENAVYRQFLQDMLDAKKTT